MAEAGSNPQPAQGAQPNLGIIAQYVKDLSFENPGSPASLLQQGQQPSINVQIGVQSNQRGPDQYEVELRIEARATGGETVLFAVELVYAGLFRIANFPAENIRPVALIECPRLIFPFARQILADATRNGGFPPLLLDPVDFAALYRQQVDNAGAVAGNA
jgi:preprotein translocase subunit SecB